MVYEKNAFSTPFLSGYKTLKIPIVDANGVSAWPEVFPIQRVDEMRQIVGARHFSAQMMLEFVSADRARLDPGGLHFYETEFDAHTAKLGNFLITGMCLYWDPSSGRASRDNSVCVLLYRDDKNRCIFIHDILYLTVPESTEYPLSYQCDMVLNFMRDNDIRRISVETNGIGGGLPEIMRNAATKMGIDIYINRISNTRTKVDRILDAIEPVLTTGRLYAHTRVRNTPLLAEMLGFSPNGATNTHDDGLDAIAGAIADTPISVRPSIGKASTYWAKMDFKI